MSNDSESIGLQNGYLECSKIWFSKKSFDILIFLFFQIFQKTFMLGPYQMHAKFQVSSFIGSCWRDQKSLNSHLHLLDL